MSLPSSLSSPRISLVAALARNGVIGRNNALPWHLPEDLKRFKALTLGHAVIMGRKTFDSIIATLGKPLPGRTSIVMTRSPPSQPGGEMADVRFVASLDQALASAGNGEEVFVIGGAEIYALSLPRAARLYLTEVLADVEGDAFFPPIDRAHWQETRREPGSVPSKGGLDYEFVIYDWRECPESLVR